MIGYSFSTTGLFSSIARALISASSARIAFTSKEVLNGESVFRYDFRFMPSELPWSIDFGKESGVAGEEGWFLVGTSNLILRRVVLRAIDIPRNLKLKRLDAVIDYEPETIAERRVLLPYVAEVHLMEANGTQRVSRMFFNHCHSFTTESRLVFDNAEKDLSESEPEAKPNLPPDINISIALRSPINPAAAMANDIVTATVAEPVFWKRREIVGAGATVEGHVFPEHGQEAVIVEFDRIQMKSGWAPFYARLVSLNGISLANARDVAVRKQPRQGAPESAGGLAATDPEIPGVARIDLTNGPKAELPAGTQMTWKTEALALPVQSRQPELSTPISVH